MNRKLNIWDAMFYGGLLILALWAILKSIGVIQTPAWLEVGVPIFSGLIAFGGLYQQVFAMIHNIKTEMNDIKIDVVLVKSKVEHLDKDMEFVKKDLGLVKTDIEIVKTDVMLLKRK